MKNLIIGTLVTITAIPAIVAGASLTQSLIAGKTTSEALVILAEQIDILGTKQEVSEATTTALVVNQSVLETTTNDLVVKQSAIENSINTLAAENALLKSKNQLLEQKSDILEQKSATLEQKSTALEQKSTKLEQDLQATVASLPPPPPAETHTLTLSLNTYGYEVVHTEGKKAYLMAVRVTNTGNTATNIESFIINQIGACELAEVWSAKGNDAFLGSTSVFGCEAPLSLPVNYVVPSGEFRDVVIYGRMADPFRIDERGSFSLELTGAVATNGTISGYPLVGYTFTASSTPKKN